MSMAFGKLSVVMCPEHLKSRQEIPMKSKIGRKIDEQYCDISCVDRIKSKLTFCHSRSPMRVHGSIWLYKPGQANILDRWQNINELLSGHKSSGDADLFIKPLYSYTHMHMYVIWGSSLITLQYTCAVTESSRDPDIKWHKSLSSCIFFI